jgi:hypothetical protein
VRLAFAGVGATLGLHFAWEMLQAPAFESFAPTVWAGTVRCFVAALGDVLIAGAAYVATALIVRSASWPVRAQWVGPALLWLVCGLIVTVVFELWALAQGRWVYGPAMPLLFGVGLLPLLQWVIVPLATLAVVRYVAGRRRAV